MSHGAPPGMWLMLYIFVSYLRGILGRQLSIWNVISCIFESWALWISIDGGRFRWGVCLGFALVNVSIPNVLEIISGRDILICIL